MLPVCQSLFTLPPGLGLRSLSREVSHLRSDMLKFCFTASQGKINNWKLFVTGYWALTLELWKPWKAWEHGGLGAVLSFGSWGSIKELCAQILSYLTGKLSRNRELAEILVTWWTRKWAERLELEKLVGYLWEAWKINNLLKIAQFWTVSKFW